MRSAHASTDSAPVAFPTTNWSTVLRARAGSESQARLALDSLCRKYWYPVYSFLRRSGQSHHDAEDRTQALFARLLANDGISHAQPDRGRFRSFLLAALRHLLANEWRDGRRDKRGGGAVPVPLDGEEAEARLGREVADPALTPEQAFDRNWALAQLGHVVAELQAEQVARGRGPMFDELRPLLFGNPGADSLVGLAARLHLTPKALAGSLHRLRRRLGTKLRAAVADTVADPGDVDGELRHLIAAMR